MRQWDRMQPWTGLAGRGGCKWQAGVGKRAGESRSCARCVVLAVLLSVSRSTPSSSAVVRHNRRADQWARDAAEAWGKLGRTVPAAWSVGVGTNRRRWGRLLTILR